ncbi:MAG: AAA family ATPase [Bacteroidales bacterium]|nr:AAA family ATPase [Bacteroidales bacterium]
MQLKRLYIQDYKIFKGFTYDFPKSPEILNNVIIGVNGSGKSTILEVLAQIFSDVILKEKSKFGFLLEYLMPNNLDIAIYAASSNDRIVLEVSKEGKTVSSFDVINKEQDIYEFGVKKLSLYDLIPSNIVVYYSGLSEILKNIIQPHNILTSKRYREGNTISNNGLFYFQPKHFNIILLSLLSFEYGDIPKFLEKKAKISGFKSLTIRLQKPDWASDTIEKFWGARGEVRKFLDYLEENETTPEELSNPELSKRPGSIVIETWKDEFIIITIVNQKRLFEIRDFLIEERKLFDIMNIMLYDGLLKNISFTLIKQNNELKNFNVLSEGEQQIITIKGLSELLVNQNSLFLFDEPDTYLHPRWQRQFIQEIEETISSNINNKITFLIATHSPQLLSNANPERTSVRIIEEGQLIESTPKYYGREISSILYNLMGVEERNKTIKKDLSNLFTLIEDEEIEGAELELTRLTEILGETDPDIKDAELQIQYLKEDEADN